MPIQSLSTLAADLATPSTTIPGKVTPVGPSQAKCSTISATTAATASGLAGSGVGTRSRSRVSRPFATSTGAPLIPDPPMSIPSASMYLPPVDSPFPPIGG